jgi:uncharacterized protein
MSLSRRISLAGRLAVTLLRVSALAVLVAAASSQIAAQSNAGADNCGLVDLSEFRAGGPPASAAPAGAKLANARHPRTPGEVNQVGIDEFIGITGERDYASAWRWFENAARKGFAPAEVNLAVLYARGWGVRQSLGTALYWLQEAARSGNARAQFDLGILFFHGCGVPQDYAEAFRYFESGANGGDSGAQTNLAYFYDRGLGVTRDQAAAAKWYRRAADSGAALAQYDLADMYERGDGLAQDNAVAFYWYAKAAAAGHTGAQIRLGWMYSQGRGTPLDTEAACAWIEAAKLAGDSRGAVILESLARKLSPEQLERAHARAAAISSERQDRRLDAFAR